MGSAVVVKSSCVAMMMCIMALGGMAEFTCREVEPVLDACGSYVKTGGNTIPQNCCMQALALRNLVRSSTPNQRVACHCIQDAAHKANYINRTAYENLPSKCGIILPYHFSLTMNCDHL